MSKFSGWWRQNYLKVLFPLTLASAIWYFGSFYTFYQEHDRLPHSDWEMLSWMTGL